VKRARSKVSKIEQTSKTGNMYPGSVLEPERGHELVAANPTFDPHDRFIRVARFSKPNSLGFGLFSLFMLNQPM